MMNVVYKLQSLCDLSQNLAEIKTYKNRSEYMAESIMLEKAKIFAIDIVNTCKEIKSKYRESVLTNQLIRSGTSIGANIYESKYAHIFDKYR